MPAFLKDLRRRSRSAFPSDNSSSESSKNSSNGTSTQPVTTASSRSSVTLSSLLGSLKSPTSQNPLEKTDSNTMFPNGAATSTSVLPPRPQLSHTKRYSINGVISPTASYQKPVTSTSPLAPRILSVSDNSWVHQKLLLVYGTIGEPTLQPASGNITVFHHQDSFPPTSWPVTDSYFKALVYLQPGPNRLRFDFTSVKSSQQSIVHSSYLNVNCLPLSSSPPLDLAIIVAKDSPETFDSTPERIEKEGNGLGTAIRKFRMAAYLCQAFTGEQMNRNGFGRRCYRYEESWQQSTLSARDLEAKQMRNEIMIHVIRSEKTLQEMRDLDLAQQYKQGKRRGDLFKVASDAVKAYFHPLPGQKRYVSCLLLDAHWDPEIGTIRGHAALGGGDSNLRLAIFGSHALHSYPACIEEVVPAFTDTTPTDTQHVANDCHESGSNWEAANIGIGAQLHEIGHLFGCPHQQFGVMLRDYVTMNRTFTTREAYCTRTKSAGKELCLQQDECKWHRLDCLRFRYHPCFRLPTDPVPVLDDTINLWPTENGVALVTATTGIAWIELFTEGDDVCPAFVEYTAEASNGTSSSPPTAAATIPPRQVSLNENDLRNRLPADRRSKKLKIVVYSASGREHTVDDFSRLVSKASRLKLSNGQTAIRGSKLGNSETEGSQPEEIILHSYNSSQGLSASNADGKDASNGNNGNNGKLLTSVRVYHGLFVDGLEFFYENATTQLFGKRGGKPGGSDFVLDTRKGEMIVGFYVRAGSWIDGIQILTSLGRKSELYGNATGGSGRRLYPPRGFDMAGITGSCGSWLDGFALIVTR